MTLTNETQLIFAFDPSYFLLFNTTIETLIQKRLDKTYFKFKEHLNEIKNWAKRQLRRQDNKERQSGKVCLLALARTSTSIFRFLS